MTAVEFYNWLEERDALHPWLENVIAATDSDPDEVAAALLRRNYKVIISRIFPWSNTPQTFIYWATLDAEFRGIELPNELNDVK